MSGRNAGSGASRSCTEDRHLWRPGRLSTRCLCGEVGRCCASFTDGRQCRRRAIAAGFCERHAWVSQRAEELTRAALEADAASSRENAEEDE